MPSIGLLATYQLFSAEELILEHDIYQRARHAVMEVAIDDEQLAFDAIADVGPGRALPGPPAHPRPPARDDALRDHPRTRGRRRVPRPGRGGARAGPAAARRVPAGALAGRPRRRAGRHRRRRRRGLAELAGGVGRQPSRRSARLPGPHARKAPAFVGNETPARGTAGERLPRRLHLVRTAVRTSRPGKGRPWLSCTSCSGLTGRWGRPSCAVWREEGLRVQRGGQRPVPAHAAPSRQTSRSIHGDAVYRHSAIDAARGATVVYRCIPVRYSLWADVWLTATENIIAAAGKAGAVLVSPGQRVRLRTSGGTPVDEDHPLPRAVRRAACGWSRRAPLCRAHRDGEVQVVIPRFPDLYGPCVTTGSSGRSSSAWPPVTRSPGSAIRTWRATSSSSKTPPPPPCCSARSPKAYGHVWHVPGPGAITPRAFIERSSRSPVTGRACTA